MLLQTISAFFIMLGIDIIWLTVLSRGFYITNLRPLLRLTSEGKLSALPLPAVLVYVGLALGLVVFVLPKAQGSLWLALLYGALFGLVVYGVYECTNYSMITLWPLKVVLVDIIWGMVLCGLASVIVAKIFF